MKELGLHLELSLSGKMSNKAEYLYDKSGIYVSFV